MYNLFLCVSACGVIAGKPHEELTVTWNWNGEFYIEEYVKTNLEEIKRRNKIFTAKRYEFLLTEFKKHNNLVYRYFIAFELPKSIENYPIELRDIAKEVVDIISNEKFPTSIDPLKEQIKGNLELEKLIFKS